MPSTPTIAIIGGGPAGLTLARLLHVNNISSTVFESDASQTSRGDFGQGGTLDLHEDSGQKALKEAGLYEQFQKIMRVEGEAFRLADKTGHLFMEDSEISRTRPEVDRIQLRSMLLDSIPADSIRWGSRVKSIEGPDKDGRWGVVFYDDKNPTEFFDILIGADGAWSKVRPVLSDARPFYSGISGLEVRFKNVDKAHAEIAELVGVGSYFAFGDSKGLFAQRNGDGSIRNYVMLRTPEDWITDCGINFSDPVETKDRMVKQYFNDWDERLKDLIRMADDDSVVARKMWMLPLGLQWASRSGITLIGDSAHLMTPFSGVGVNVAMEDALELALSLVAWRDSSGADKAVGLAEALRSYEENMFKRAKENAEDTWDSLELIFRNDAPKPFHDKILRLMAAGAPDHEHD